MAGGYGTFMSRVHRLKHIHNFFSAHFSHYNSIRAHSESVLDQSADADDVSSLVELRISIATT